MLNVLVATKEMIEVVARAEVGGEAETLTDPWIHMFHHTNVDLDRRDRAPHLLVGHILVRPVVVVLGITQSPALTRVKRSALVTTVVVFLLGVGSAQSRLTLVDVGHRSALEPEAIVVLLETDAEEAQSPQRVAVIIDTHISPVHQCSIVAHRFPEGDVAGAHPQYRLEAPLLDERNEDTLEESVPSHAPQRALRRARNLHLADQKPPGAFNLERQTTELEDFVQLALLVPQMQNALMFAKETISTTISVHGWVEAAAAVEAVVGVEQRESGVIQG